MDQDRARSLLIAERDEVQGLLKDAEVAGQEDRLSEVDRRAGRHLRRRAAANRRGHG